MKFTLKQIKYKRVKMTRHLVQYARAAGRGYFLIHQMLAAGYLFSEKGKGIYVFKKQKEKKLIRKKK